MFGNTKNKFLDLLLNKYKSICDSSGISFEYNIRTANLSFMDAPDLITLLSGERFRKENDRAFDKQGQ